MHLFFVVFLLKLMFLFFFYAMFFDQLNLSCRYSFVRLPSAVCLCQLSSIVALVWIVEEFRAGVSKLRPAGRIRPAKVFHPARRAHFKNAYTDFSHRWIELCWERTVSGFYLVHLVGQRGPTTGPRNNFAQALSITSSGSMILGRK